MLKSTFSDAWAAERLAEVVCVDRHFDGLGRVAVDDGGDAARGAQPTVGALAGLGARLYFQVYSLHVIATPRRCCLALPPAGAGRAARVHSGTIPANNALPRLFGTAEGDAAPGGKGMRLRGEAKAPAVASSQRHPRVCLHGPWIGANLRPSFFVESCGGLYCLLMQGFPLSRGDGRPRRDARGRARRGEHGALSIGTAAMMTTRAFLAAMITLSAGLAWAQPAGGKPADAGGPPPAEARQGRLRERLRGAAGFRGDRHTTGGLVSGMRQFMQAELRNVPALEEKWRRCRRSSRSAPRSRGGERRSRAPKPAMTATSSRGSTRR